jgi:hypothetical protein
MDFKVLYEKYAVIFSSAFSICTAFALHFNPMLGGFVLIFAGLIFTGFFTVLDFMRSEGRKLFIFAVLVLFGLIISAVLLFTEIPVGDSFYWFFYSGNLNAENALSYSFISLTIMLFAAIGVLFNLLRFKYIRFAAGIVVAVFCVIMAVFEVNTDFSVILLFFFFIFIVLHEWFLRKIIPLTFLLPFMLIAALFTSIMPSRQEPLQWEFAKAIIRSVREAAINTFSSGEPHEFGLNMTGYTESGRIGSGITPSGGDALRIRNNTRSASHIYFAGTFMDVYTGSGWERSTNFDNFPLPEYYSDFLETVLALYNGGIFEKPPEIRDEIFAARDIEIAYQSLNTRTIFAPHKTYSLRVGENSDYSGSSKFFNRVAGNGTEYRVMYLDLNYNNDLIINLLEDGVYERSELDIIYLNRLINVHFPGAFFTNNENYAEILEMRREKIYDVYTKLPASVPSSVYDLAIEITDEYNSEYKKMKAIENYLRDNFSYTRTPPQFSDRTGDFTAAFLFNMREGYCTYFATAAAVLGRAAGIPTRYVQGFTVNTLATERGQSYIIRNDHAHAWIEAYIDGIGWVPFEPSPSFTGAGNSVWVSRRPAPHELIMQQEIQENQANQENQEISETPEDIEQRMETERRNIYIIALITGGAVIIIAVSAVLAGFYITALRIRKKYRNSSHTERFLIDYKTILLLFEITGEKLYTGETAGQFALRIDDEIFTELTKTFEEVKYGGKTITADEASPAAEYRKILSMKNGGIKSGKMKFLSFLWHRKI